MEHLTEMLKGVLEGCVLEILSRGETYGYEITKRLNALGISIGQKPALLVCQLHLWIVSGILVTLAFSLVFGWFTVFPLWCFLLFLLLPAVGMVALILAYYLELSHETKLLNWELERFQKQGEGKNNG